MKLVKTLYGTVNNKQGMATHVILYCCQAKGYATVTICDYTYQFVAFHCYFQMFRREHATVLSNLFQNIPRVIDRMLVDTTQLLCPMIHDLHNYW